MSRLTRDETAKPVSRDQILRRDLGTGNSSFSLLSSADHEQDGQAAYHSRLIDTLLLSDDHIPVPGIHYINTYMSDEYARG